MNGIRRTLAVAGREFASTALTKGFILGALILPAIFAIVMPLIGFLIEQAKPPAVVGRIAIIDRGEPDQRVGTLLTERLTPESLASASSEAAKTLASVEGGADNDETRDAVADAASAMLGDTPRFTVELLAPATDVEDAKGRLLEEPDNKDDATLAVVEIEPDAAARTDPGEPFGGYTLYTRPKVDVRTSGTIDRVVSRAIKDVRYELAGVDAAELRELTTVVSHGTKEVTSTGTRESNKFAKLILPFATMFLLFMGVMTGGQYLLTTTVEEKSSRVVEVLLSAVSPMQLMVGKILGQMLVGLLLLAMYAGLGVIALATFALFDLIEWLDLVYMLIFFVIAYLTIASFMAAVGSAVNEMREAQSLMAPVMIVLLVAFYLSIPVSLSPSAPWAVALSFIPPVSNFAMLTRIASTEPPPGWQVWLSILVSGLGAWASMWLAAKVFRVGLLMFGKPPNVRTLIRWVRMS